MLLLGVGHKGWLPPVLGSLLFWHKADAGTYADNALTTQAVADGPVGGWADQTGNGLHLTQPDEGIEPTFKLNRQNGRPALFFPGSQQYLTVDVPALNAAAAYTLALAWQRHGSTANVRFFGGNDNQALLIRSGTDLRSTVTPGNFGAATFDTTAFALHVVRFDGGGADNAARLRRWHNGSEETLAYTGTIPATDSATGRFIVSYPAIGADLDCGEVLCWGAALSTQQIADVFAYLNARWAAY